MEASLRTLLVERNKVHEDTIKAMIDMECLTLANFANWVDERSQLKEAILSKVETRKNDQSELAKLKQAWREADASFARGVKRQADGLEHEGLDDPLGEEVFKQINKNFRQHYNWLGIFDSRRIGCDSLHGRFRREFERKQPSMYNIMKAKSQAKSSREEQKKHTKLNDLITLTMTEGQHRDGPASLGKWFTCFDIVINTWAVAGCFDVTPKDLSAAKKYVHWGEVQAYLYEFTVKSNELKENYVPEQQIYYYLSLVEEEFRAKAVEMARSEAETPWGEALIKSLKENAHIWAEKKDKHFQGYYGTDHQKVNLKTHPKAPNFATQQLAAKSKPPCNSFNKDGGCTNRNCQYAHICNFRMPDGNFCGKTNHNVLGHNPTKGGGAAKGGGRGGGRGGGKGRKRY